MWNYSAVSGGSFGGWGGRGGTITSPGYRSTTGIIAADFQGTGVKSVLAAMTGAPAYSDVRARSLYSSSTFSSQTVLSPPSDITKCLTAVDADFDLKMDFAVTTNLGNIQVYRGSSLTSVLTIDTSAGSPGVSSPRTGRMASGDLDNDGRPDILATTSHWACEGMASSHGSYHALGVVGDGGSQGVVFHLNTSN